MVYEHDTIDARGWWKTGVWSPKTLLEFLNGNDKLRNKFWALHRDFADVIGVDAPQEIRQAMTPKNDGADETANAEKVQLETVVAQSVRSVSVGQLCGVTEDMTIYDRSLRLTRDDGRLLGVLLKNVLGKDLVEAGKGLAIYAKTTTTNRAMAAGTVGGKPVAVHSSTVGFSDNPTPQLHGLESCRQTALYRDNEQYFDDETMPLVRAINDLYRTHCPDEHQKQFEFVQALNQEMVLSETAFSTITVNKDFRTHSHRDSGDFREGLGNLAVFEYQPFSGGEFLLPEWDVGFNVQTGDVLFVDVHEIHCNNFISGKGRLSLVCYAREGITKCHGLSREDIRSK